MKTKIVFEFVCMTHNGLPRLLSPRNNNEMQPIQGKVVAPHLTLICPTSSTCRADWGQLVTGVHKALILGPDVLSTKTILYTIQRRILSFIPAQMRSRTPPWAHHPYKALSSVGEGAQNLRKQPGPSHQHWGRVLYMARRLRHLPRMAR